MTGPRPTRRQLLGVTTAGAGAAAATAAGIHLGLPGLLASLTVPRPAISADGWPSPLTSSRGLAAHLLRRAGFTYTASDLDTAASMSYDALVESVLAQGAQPLPAVADVTDHALVVGSWYRHMATTPAQFPERMALFWHGVLTSSYRNAHHLPYVYLNNHVLRNAGRSDLRTLLTAITLDPLMMRYLNLDASTAAAPNENYSRELMELFTLGPGNFTEADVREGARALSGLRIGFFDSAGRRAPSPPYSKSDPAAFVQQVNQFIAGGATFRGTVVPRLHDGGTKTFLGRTGDLGPEDVIDAILAQPSCAPFVTRRAMTFFATPNPSAADVTAVAAQFRGSGYDISTLMRAIFHSDSFTSPTQYRSLVRSPADLIVAALGATARAELVRPGLLASPGMDQVLYDPPNVAGWPSNAGWLSSGTLLARLNFAAAVAAQPGLPDPGGVVDVLLDGVLGADTRNAYQTAPTNQARWYALLAGPEFQLK